MGVTIDQRYVWQGFANDTGNWQSACRLRVFTPHPEQVFVVLSDGAGDGEGTSISNCAEHLLPRIAKEFNLNPAITVWLHHYQGCGGEVTISQINLSISDQGRRMAHWEPVQKKKAEQWIGVRF